MSPEVSLLPFAADQLPLLKQWLNEPHVRRWYPQPAEHLEWAMHPPPGGKPALIAVNGAPVGYLRWQPVSREILDTVGLFEIPANSVDIDILIGQASHIGRGIGPQALALLVSQLREDTSIPLLGLSPAIENQAAQRAYRKVGFQSLREYDAPGYGRCLLMIRELNCNLELAKLSNDTPD
jgi:aminoglycoside 6'-N-acetyltransferase